MFDRIAYGDDSHLREVNNISVSVILHLAEDGGTRTLSTGDLYSIEWECTASIRLLHTDSTNACAVLRYVSRDFASFTLTHRARYKLVTFAEMSLLSCGHWTPAEHP